MTKTCWHVGIPWQRTGECFVVVLANVLLYMARHNQLMCLHIERWFRRPMYHQSAPIISGFLQMPLMAVIQCWSAR
jgi:hypothetical protein